MAAMATHHKFKMMERVTMFLVLGFMGFTVLESKKAYQPKKQGTQYLGFSCRNTVKSLYDYGGKGDGNTLNTAAFKAAITDLSFAARHGGAMLVVPAGKWLTGSINLISHFTLYLHPNAVILASKNESDYPLIDPLPSYGSERDALGKRFASLIHGKNLTDVVITGGNGTIDGQGASWWKQRNHLKHPRPHLIELMSSYEVLISNITLRNSPNSHIHPVYCTNSIIENITIITVVDSPYTDGIIPDSCNNTRIRDVYIVSGGDCIAVKSGLDEYGISYKMPTRRLSIKRLTCVSPNSAVIALGSEMSGGIQDVRVDDVYSTNSQTGIAILTAAGRGGYMKDIFIRGMILFRLTYGFMVSGRYKSHHDRHYNRSALPVINNINFMEFYMDNVTFVGDLLGMKQDPFTNFCFSNVVLDLAPNRNGTWNCAYISGVWSTVSPEMCTSLQEFPGMEECYYPKDTLAIDAVVLKTCSASF